MKQYHVRHQLLRYVQFYALPTDYDTVSDGPQPFPMNRFPIRENAKLVIRTLERLFAEAYAIQAVNKLFAVHPLEHDRIPVLKRPVDAPPADIVIPITPQIFFIQFGGVRGHFKIRAGYDQPSGFLVFSRPIPPDMRYR